MKDERLRRAPPSEDAPAVSSSGRSALSVASLASSSALRASRDCHPGHKPGVNARSAVRRRRGGQMLQLVFEDRSGDRNPPGGELAHSRDLATPLPPRNVLCSGRLPIWLLAVSIAQSPSSTLSRICAECSSRPLIPYSMSFFIASCKARDNVFSFAIGATSVSLNLTLRIKSRDCDLGLVGTKDLHGRAKLD